MIAAIECEGAPRDLGRDQGHACAARLCERFAAEPFGLRARWRLGLASRDAARLRRELGRHFPRHAEALAGIAHATGLPQAWLAERLARETGPALAAGAGAERARGDAVLGREADGEWIVRRSRPEGGFRAVELTRPWLAHGLLGVNETGLAVAVSCGGAAEPGGAPALTRVPPARTRAVDPRLPAAALATDCLQRFSTLDACLAWCQARPAEAPATLLFADATGELAGIEIGPRRRRVLRSAEGWLAVGGDPLARERVAKGLRDGTGLGDALARALPAARALRVGRGHFEV